MVNGSHRLEGRVEICFNSAWGTVCDNGFGEDEAEVVCRQLDSQYGYAHDGFASFRGAAFGEGDGPIFMDNLGCSGNEGKLSTCPTFSETGFHQCDHTMDAGVICRGQSPMYNVTLSNTYFALKSYSICVSIVLMIQDDPV